MFRCVEVNCGMMTVAEFKSCYRFRWVGSKAGCYAVLCLVKISALWQLQRFHSPMWDHYSMCILEEQFRMLCPHFSIKNSFQSKKRILLSDSDILHALVWEWLPSTVENDLRWGTSSSLQGYYLMMENICRKNHLLGLRSRETTVSCTWIWSQADRFPILMSVYFQQYA